MTPAERKKKIARIKALLAMTVERGASETEMNMALGLAKQMMDELNIDETDLAFGGEETVIEQRVVTDFDKIRYELYTPVGKFCQCSSWKIGKGSDGIAFCGLESEVVFAHWMLDMLADFVLYSLTRHGERNGMRRIPRDVRAAFIVGCTTRIAQRLRDLTPRPPPGRGRDLVVAKDALIKKCLDDNGIKFRDNFKLYSLDPVAYAAGERAGDDARFNRPIDGMQETRLIR